MRHIIGYKSFASASAIPDGIELIHMMRKRQARYAFNSDPSLAEQFAILVV